MSFEPNRQTGANKQSRRSPTPRTLLKQLMDDSPNPHSSEEREAIFSDFRQRVFTEVDIDIDGLDPEALIEGVLEYWFTNNYRSLLADYPQPGAPSRQERKEAARETAQARKEEIKTTFVKAAAKVAQLLLLDLMLPNGKALRDCTGAECVRLGPKVGNWLARVGKKVKPTQTVGAVLSEAEVQKLYR